MKKIIIFMFTTLLTVIVIQGECYAKKYYSFAIYESKGESGQKISMNIISKTLEGGTCRATASSNPKVQGAWILAGSECVSGVEYDKHFSPIFNNRPIIGPYLSYRNLGELETRINFKVVSGPNSPLPGYPIDIPTHEIMPAIYSIKQLLEIAGIRNIKIIHSKEN